MNAWILSIGSVIIITTIITILLPENKMGKYIRGYFALIVMVVILSPIVKIKDVNLDNIFKSNIEDVIVQNQYIDYINQQKITYLEKNCKNICENYGINDAVVIIQYSVDDSNAIAINSVTLNLSPTSITQVENVEKITNDIKDAVSKYLCIEVNKIIVK